MSEKIKASPMVYICGEEMSAAAMRGKKMLLDLLIKPHFDISSWDSFDFSVVNRKKNQTVWDDAAAKIVEYGVAYKEQTITPNSEQKVEWGVNFGSPNHALREAIQGFSIDRDTINPPGASTGYEKPVYTCRYPLGDGYSIKNSYGIVPQAGEYKIVFTPEGSDEETTIGEPQKVAKNTLLAGLNTPLEQWQDFFRYSMQRALDLNVRYIYIDKGTAFKYQTEYSKIGREIFENEFHQKFLSAGLIDEDYEFQPMLSDNASMKLVSWKKGGYLMAAPNYEMDILADQAAMTQNDPAHVTSVLLGKKGEVWDAGHGTDPANYELYKDGDRDYFNPMSQALGLCNAMLKATRNEVTRGAAGEEKLEQLESFAAKFKEALLSSVSENQKCEYKWTCQELLVATARKLNRHLDKSELNTDLDKEFGNIRSTRSGERTR